MTGLVIALVVLQSLNLLFTLAHYSTTQQVLKSFVPPSDARGLRG